MSGLRTTLTSRDATVRVRLVIGFWASVALIAAAAKGWLW